MKTVKRQRRLANPARPPDVAQLQSAGKTVNDCCRQYVIVVIAEFHLSSLIKYNSIFCLHLFHQFNNNSIDGADPLSLVWTCVHRWRSSIEILKL